MTPTIEVNHLYKNYRQFTAVSDLSFSVNKGDVFGFLGENGAGKSTTIRMLLSLIEPSAGVINFWGDSL
jgi:ABC-2 type transport system ATP-binding protein